MASAVPVDRQTPDAVPDSRDEYIKTPPEYEMLATMVGRERLWAQTTRKITRSRTGVGGIV
jgi:hypothetical protein